MNNFFLELFVIERGYSKSNGFPPKSVIEEIKNKINLLKSDDFGYVIMVEEPSPDMDDESRGVLYMPINILPTKSFKTKLHFLNLVEKVENLYKQDMGGRQDPNVKSVQQLSGASIL